MAQSSSRRRSERIIYTLNLRNQLGLLLPWHCSPGFKETSRRRSLSTGADRWAQAWLARVRRPLRAQLRWKLIKVLAAARRRNDDHDLWPLSAQLYSRAQFHTHTHTQRGWPGVVELRRSKGGKLIFSISTQCPAAPLECGGGGVSCKQQRSFCSLLAASAPAFASAELRRNACAELMKRYQHSCTWPAISRLRSKEEGKEAAEE